MSSKQDWLFSKSWHWNLNRILWPIPNPSVYRSASSVGFYIHRRRQERSRSRWLSVETEMKTVLPKCILPSHSISPLDVIKAVTFYVLVYVRTVHSIRRNINNLSPLLAAGWQQIKKINHPSTLCAIDSKPNKCASDHYLSFIKLSFTHFDSSWF